MTLRPETIERMMCDCVVHRVVMAEGVVLDYGRAVKDPPPETWTTHPPGRLRQQLPPPPGTDPDADIPFEDHLDAFERELILRQRIDALVNEGKQINAIRALMIFPERAA